MGLLNKDQAATFKARVETFWDWYAGQAAGIFERIENQESEGLEDLVGPAVDKLGPGFGWVFGPGEPDGHSLTLTPEGILSHQFLADYWKNRAPELPGWTFYSSRQRSRNIESIGLNIMGEKLSTTELWITGRPDTEHERIDITAWHPLFAKLPERDQYTILFLLLDEALGEHGTAGSIGEIELNDQRLQDAFPLSELKEHVEKTFADQGWQPIVPGESVTLYSIEPSELDFPRADSFTLGSSYPNLVFEYLDKEGKLDEDPVAANGADFVFIYVPSDYFPEGNEAQARGDIEDAIEDRLINAQAGALIGGSAGEHLTYSDFVIFDGEHSVAVIQEAMVDFGLPQGSGLRYFAQRPEGFQL